MEVRTQPRHTILIRPSGELATKSRNTRRRFQRKLVACLEDALASVGRPFEVRDEWGRLFAETDSSAATDLISRVFGIASLSPVEACAPPRLDAILEVGERVYTERVRGRSFAVRARRADRRLPFSSRDINYGLGAALNRFGSVDLDHPDIEVSVEVREDSAYFFSRRIPGAGGLPGGTQGMAVALISGGYDSAVAAWMMLKRGVALDYVFCNLAGSAYERAVLSVAKSIADRWSYGTRPVIHIVDFEAPLRHMKEQVSESYWQVILKRIMVRVGERIAGQSGAYAVVTGESLGQVSSQTLANLCAIDASAQVPILRPCICLDKGEIIALSREIGTYPLSEKVQEHCALTERRPVTETTAEAAAAEEAKLDLSVLERAIDTRRILDLRELDAGELVLPYLYATTIPAEAVVIDTRPAAQFDAWHAPGALHRDYWDLLGGFETLDRSQTYVLYCDLGLKTAQLVEKMQRAGYEAYSFKGGARSLREVLVGASATRGNRSDRPHRRG